MRVFDNPSEMTRWSLEQHASGRKIGFVPTMGALHDGHIALIRRSQNLADVTVVSIFVNKLQFNVAEDFDKYPRPLQEDLVKCEQMGVNAIYAPTHDAMYPPEFDTKVAPGFLGSTMEGAARPGHFEGMTTVVAKLFNTVVPHFAVFGQKDYQQLAIVRAMVRDLNMPIAIEGLPTVREHDGLALSSRNVRLSPHARAFARAIPASLEAAEEMFASGIRDARRIESAVTQILADTEGLRIDYVQVADAATLREVTYIDSDVVLAVAVWFGDVRLIDNVVLELQR